MTNHWVDIKNADCIMIIGSNAAENHPMSFRWIEEARKPVANGGRNAKLIVIDPRISRSANQADMYGRIRSGTDIAFIGGLINWALTHNMYNADYAKNYSNLAYVLNGFDAAINPGPNYNNFTGEFPGYNSATHKYDGAGTSAWTYAIGASGPTVDNTLANTETVFNVLKKFYARYTSDLVSRITGMDKTLFEQIAQEYCSTYADGKSGLIMYAMGTTQHTYGTQNIRAYSILQTLLGNIGVAGGGIAAMRGESNVQGSTDMGLLFGNLPGYLDIPNSTMATLGIQTTTSTQKLTGTLTAGTASGRVISGLTGVDATQVRSGDKIQNTTLGGTANTYTIEAVINATTVRITANMGTAWTLGDGYAITSESGINHLTGSTSFLGQTVAKGVAGTADILNTARFSNNWKQHEVKYMMSLLAAWWGSSNSFILGGANGDFCYDFLPKINSAVNYSYMSVFKQIETLAATPSVPQLMMCWGMNPAVGGPDVIHGRKMLANLTTLVCVDLWETETAAFWKEDPANPGYSYAASGSQDATLTPTAIQTTVYLLPAKASMEKEGSVSNSGRWVQWRYGAEDGGVMVQKGTAKSDLDIANDLMLQLKTNYAAATTIAGGLGIKEMSWGPNTPNNYGIQFSEADPKAVMKEINGYTLLYPANIGGTAAKGNQLSSFISDLKFDGTTACGSWIHCGCWVQTDVTTPTGTYQGNRAAKRISVDNSATGIGLYSDFSWCWPVNRRIIYNRASMKPVAVDGYVPFQTDKWVMKYDYVTSTWFAGSDVVDGGANTKPDAYMPFIMKPEGVARLFGLNSTKHVDGPLPEHYEPAETPLATHPFGASHVMWNPIVMHMDAGPVLWAQYNFVPGTVANYPYVGTTYRLVEHWQAGAMTRNLPWLVELQPEMFVEMSYELAALLAVNNGDHVKVTTARNPNNPVLAVALVTKRIKPFTIMGNTVHQIGMPWHFGYRGLAQGTSANRLTPNIGDANTRIPEYKAFLCKVEKV